MDIPEVPVVHKVVSSTLSGPNSPQQEFELQPDELYSQCEVLYLALHVHKSSEACKQQYSKI